VHLPLRRRFRLTSVFTMSAINLKSLRKLHVDKVASTSDVP
jgi:hypothetical protein